MALFLVEIKHNNKDLDYEKLILNHLLINNRNQHRVQKYFRFLKRVSFCQWKFNE